MKPETCPFCHRELDMTKAVDCGSFWTIVCDHCNRGCIKSKERKEE